MLFGLEATPEELSGGVGRFAGDGDGEGGSEPGDGDFSGEGEKVAQTRLFEPLQATVSYSLLAHAAAHVSQDPELKYLSASHDAHLAAPCVGQSSPAAPVPPTHVHCFETLAPPSPVLSSLDKSLRQGFREETCGARSFCALA